MRFLLHLWLTMFVGYGVCHGANAPKACDLSFSVFLEINGQVIYPAGQAATDPERKPFELCVEVKGLTNQTLKRILLDVCQENLGIYVIDAFQVNIVSFLESAIMLTHVESRLESYGDSSVTSPVSSVTPISPISSVSSPICDRQRLFPSPRDLLALNSDDLIAQIQGRSLQLSIQSPTESIYTVGRRLRLREKGFDF
jgi:hypothetical protein